MKRLLLALGLLLVAIAGTATVASANGGPHGDYAADGLTDKCAGCHRLHQAQSEGKLLKAPTPYALCLTCHNGAGSRLDVLDGVRLTDTIPSRVPGITGSAVLGSLNGGGFEFINGVEVTSKHNEDPAENQRYPWGYAGSNQGNYADGTGGLLANTGSNNIALAQPLQCTGCHNPHGSPNYRLLKDYVNGNNVFVKAYYSGGFTKDEGGRGLDGTPPADKYTREYYGSAGNNTVGDANGSFGQFCGACHTAYPSNSASIGLTAQMNGVSTTHYRHRTEMPYTNWQGVATTYGFTLQNPETNPYLPNVVLRLASNGSETDTIVTCLTCHRVHGTTATMKGWAIVNTLTGSDGQPGKSPDEITPSQMVTSTSTLLYLDNRGLCEACHQWRN